VYAEVVGCVNVVIVNASPRELTGRTTQPFVWLGQLASGKLHSEEWQTAFSRLFYWHYG